MDKVTRHWQCQCCTLSGSIEHEALLISEIEEMVVEAHSDALKKEPQECENTRICHWTDIARIQEVVPEG